LTKAAKTIITEDSGESLCQCIAELEAEKNTLQRIVDNGIEDYDLLLEGNKSLLAERDDFHYSLAMVFVVAGRSSVDVCGWVVISKTGRLGRAFDRKVFSRPLFRWYFMGVL
jgi:hypothetical protein